ncbi:hypothetical protein [Sulfurospirillum multivorans]|uniref:Uncharacterized protein n=2 Tax=Sulfurospirillum multivorans TaxID=66821 RepID=A0AA86DYE7_SULMK|nr:hypothetical protein [Sulfurospirillum multivorans]AHJ11325.1 hypothetical protein SMUL_0037 [Sulfurospirillum multivorans DSM 12446]QEH04829.1 hypothetical protein SMN_0035 [Sulfurospirillum multivorans]
MKNIITFLKENTLYIDIILLVIFSITFFGTFKSFSDFFTRESIMSINVIMFFFIIGCMINEYLIDKYYIKKDQAQQTIDYFAEQKNIVESVVEEQKEQVVYEWELQREIPPQEPITRTNENPF